MASSLCRWLQGPISWFLVYRKGVAYDSSEDAQRTNRGLDRQNHNLTGARLIEVDPQRMAFEQESMNQQPFLLDQGSRRVVLHVLQDVCLHRGWCLLAAHVRTNHVHAVVEAEVRPEKIMNDFKSYASRELNRLGHDGPDRKR